MFNIIETRREPVKADEFLVVPEGMHATSSQAAVLPVPSNPTPRTECRPQIFV